MRRAILACAVCVLVVSARVEGQSTREVSYTDRSVVRVHAKVRFTTLIILPDREEILDFVCGDSDFWVISGAQNLAYVKPAKAGITTNLNLVTAAGHVYSFLLTEGAADPDLKIYVTPGEGFGAAVGPAKFYSAAQVEDLRGALDAAHADADAAREAASQSMAAAKAAADQAGRDAEDRIRAFRAQYPAQLRFPYRFKVNARPFLVSAIFHDGEFTYIQTNASELPALWEVRDTVANLVHFQVEDGVYIVPKVLERGYLAIGAEKLAFERVR